MKTFLLFLILLPLFCKSQATYEDSLNNFLKLYVQDHEVVKGEDKKMMQFFPVSKLYRIAAVFERKENAEWFLMNTSGSIKKEYRVYGVITFVLNDSLVHLNIYQSKYLMTTKEYSETLFIPFTDMTSGFETYGGGRYIDLLITDIRNNIYVVDFNKAYNPYCAYTTGYNCPIPPKGNDLLIAVKAGEKNYLKH
jgi:uncharacterized protein